MEHGVISNNGSGEEQQQLWLPPGFRFHPTDEELITHYLSRKALDASFNAVAIGEVDLNKCEPWDLPWRTKVGEREWYFFCVRDRKYPTGLRTNRATEAGYWKATGKDRGVYRGRALVGMKKTLVFYRGRAPKGEKTEWVMHEYRLEGAYPISNFPKSAAKNDWVVCRVIRKSGSGTGKKTAAGTTEMAMGSSCSHSGELGVHAPLPPLMDVHSCADVTCFSNIKGQEEYPKTMDDMPESSNPRHDRTGGSLMQLLQGDIGYRPDQMMSNVSLETGITTSDMNPEISSGNARGVPSTFSAALYLQDCLWGY